MKKPLPPSENPVEADELYGLFRQNFPFASEQEIAALVAQFVESVPPTVTVTDDGAVLPNSHEPPEEEVNRLEWLGRLREFAGDAYPADAEEIGSRKS